jgi:hypothetical protein
MDLLFVNPVGFQRLAVVAASAMSLWISSGYPLTGSRTSEMASCERRAKHTPQPMQAAASMRANPSSTEIAANWQTSAHEPQPAHRSLSTCATYPDDASMGVPFRRAFIAPQQHEQQLQMA